MTMLETRAANIELLKSINDTIHKGCVNLTEW